MLTWKRGKGGTLSPHFKASEFECSCGCVDQRISPILVAQLEGLRNAYGAPIRVTSGYRCPRKQQQLRDAGYETSAGISTHELGQAADITAGDITALAKEAGNHFKAVGVAKTFVHVDLRADKVRRWGYSR